ncbi:hypothetical protein FOXYSP1_19893 [Fusarium oxysporum f. sp. phaseoli]
MIPAKRHLPTLAPKTPRSRNDRCADQAGNSTSLELPRKRRLVGIACNNCRKRKVKQVRGTGVMLGIDLISDIATDIEQKVLLEYGLVLWASTNKHYLLLTSPYAMTYEQFERVADALRKVLSNMATLAESAIRKSHQY